MKLKGLIGLAILIAALAAAFYGGGVVRFAISPYSDSQTGEPVLFEVQRGDTPSVISKNLEAQGVIADSEKFVLLGRMTRSWKNIKAGEYEVSPLQTPLAILDIITSGVSYTRPFTIREGENMYEIAAKLEEKEAGNGVSFLSLVRDPQFIATLAPSLGLSDPLPASLEGYLFPDTYRFSKSTPLDEMVRQMTRRFQAVWGEREEARAREIGLTRHQVVTLGSIIEKETGAPEERPVISSVFHNRLQKKMRLQSDPTTIYGIWETYSGNIKREHLQLKTPYNTYTIAALPVGPIANPGKESIHAALWPAQSDFLFFVSQNDGTHVFSRTYEEHGAAVRKFQIDRKAREGKSWRDLGKRKAP